MNLSEMLENLEKEYQEVCMTEAALWVVVRQKKDEAEKAQTEWLPLNDKKRKLAQKIETIKEMCKP